MADDSQVPEPPPQRPTGGQSPTGPGPANGGDATQRIDPGLLPPADPYIDDTTVLSGYDHESGAGHSGAAGRWAGRAEVGSGTTRDPVPTEPGWAAYPGSSSGRVWWAPIVIGAAFLAVLLILAAGLWLAVHNRNANQPLPGPSATSATPNTPSPASTTPAPSASASPSVAVFVLPDLRGVALSDAVNLLTGAGLNPQPIEKVATGYAPGIVIGTDPVASTAVPVGSTVKIYVAVAPPMSPTPSLSPSVSASSPVPR